jgi:hypothetical protein
VRVGDKESLVIHTSPGVDVADAITCADGKL